MNKNTVIAVILSTLVVIATFFMQTYLLPKTSEPAGNDTTQTQSSEMQSASDSEMPENKTFFTSEENANLTEEEISIKTNKADIVLTNKGGDIISYKLFKHIDVETKDGVQRAVWVSKPVPICQASKVA